DHRQEAVLAGQVELRVRPLDLDHAGDVRVQTGVSGVPSVLVRIDRVSTGKGCARARGRHFAGTARAPSGLAVGQVDLESQDGLGPPDLEDDIRTEPARCIPLSATAPADVTLIY